MVDFDDLCERIDATVFSGDLLHDNKERAEFMEYLGRWVREMDRNQASATEECEHCDKLGKMEDGKNCTHCGYSSFKEELTLMHTHETLVDVGGK